jgi:enamine deaminase RidA (YjgF/YER057c/UK114 family)
LHFCVHLRFICVHLRSRFNSRKEWKMTIQRHNVGKRLSEIVVYNNTAYLAGEVPDDTTKDITGQTEQVLAKIDRLLAQVGSDKTKILSAQIFIADMGEFAGMNAAWDKWVPQGRTPARATIEAKLANPAYKVEIMCVAAI